MSPKSSLLAIFIGASLCTATIAHPKWDGAQSYTDNGKHHQMKGKRGQHRGMLAKLERTLSKLNLSEEQKQQLQVIKESNEDTRQAIREQSSEYRAQMQALLEASNIDESAVKSLSVQIAENRANMLLKGVEVRNQAMAILNAEQLAQFEQIKLKRAEKRAKRRAAYNARQEN